MPRRQDTIALLGVLVATVVAQIPFFALGYAPMDEGSFLVIADGIRRGDVLYEDRINFVGPFSYLLLSFFLWLFGPAFWVGRALQVAIFAGSAGFVFLILRRLTPLGPALLGTAGFVALKPLGFPFWTIVNYSQPAMLWCLAGIWATLVYLDDPHPRRAWLAGIFVGLSIITKQTFAASAGGAVLAAVAVAAPENLRTWTRAIPPVLRVVGGIVAVLAATVLGFALWGNLAALVQRMTSPGQDLLEFFYVPLPSLSLWGPRLQEMSGTEIATTLFAYLPTPLLQILLEGTIRIQHWEFWTAVEIAVKLFYYVPLVLLAVGAIRLLPRRGVAWFGQESGRYVLLLAFAGLSYATILYRADWTHLTNIYPALVLLGAAFAGRGEWSRPWLRWLVGGAGGLWLLAGILLTPMIVSTYDEPVDTEAGRVYMAPDVARNVDHVLSYLREQPPDERIAIFYVEPMLYFLSGRHAPVSYDFIAPGVVTPPEDLRLARELGDVDRIVYNPSHPPNLPNPLRDFAPETAKTLVRDFEITEVLGWYAFALERRGETRRTSMQLDTEARGPGAEHWSVADWLMYRGAATTPGQNARCRRARHLVTRGEILEAVPLFDPATLQRPKGAQVRARFSIAIARPEGRRELYAQVRSPTDTPATVAIDLDDVAGRQIDLLFCVERVGPLPAPVAWMAPQVVRGGA